MGKVRAFLTAGSFALLCCGAAMAQEKVSQYKDIMLLSPAYVGDYVPDMPAPVKGMPYHGREGGIAGLPGNDDCANATPTGDGTNIPFSNVGATGDGPNPLCGGGGGWGNNDVWFLYTASCTGVVRVDMLGTDDAFDTVMAAWPAGTCPPSGNPLACNDDVGTGPLWSSIAFSATMNTQYLIQIGGFAADISGDGVINISCGTCGSECPNGGIPENDPTCAPGDDVTNGGCNSVPPVFSTIHCGDVICGTGSRAPTGTGGFRRDTDWYELVLTADTQCTFSGTPAIEYALGLVIGRVDNIGRGLCADNTGFVNPFSVVQPCSTGSVVLCLPPGRWWFFAATLNTAGNTTIVPCGSQYVITLECEPCTVPSGACCLPNGSCVNTTFAGGSGCRAQGGAYAGDGSDCSGVTCPSNDQCSGAIPVALGATVSGDTTLATYDAAPTCGVSNDPNTGGLWYSVGGNGQTITATLCSINTFFDTKMSVFCGSCSGLVCVGGNDDDPNCGIDGLQSTVSWCSQSGQTYYILVHGFNTAAGGFELFVSADGQTCSNPVNCAVPGACCLGPGVCVTSNSGDCAGMGGTFMGGGSTCGAVAYLASECGTDFEDISGNPNATPGPSCDDCGVLVNLGFNFAFFGEVKTSVRMASNGYLTFGGVDNDFSNDPIPSPGAPNDLIAPYWDDYDTSLGGSTSVLVEASRAVFQWKNVQFFGGGGDNTFQAILYADGNIDFRYGSLDGAASASTGVENAAGSAGTQIAQANVTSGSSHRLRPSIASGSCAGEGANCPTPDPCAGSRRGDSNCDGVVDNGDIDCFVQALLDLSGGAWQACALAANPSCTYDFVCTNDINGDTLVDNADIQAFVDCLLAGDDPCP